MVLVPLLTFVLAATSVRTRRSAANMAMFGAVVTFALSLLVAWGMARRTTPFQVSYPYMNISVAFTGQVNFQGFGIDIILRVDRMTSVAMLVLELCVIGALAWHRLMGRNEPGGARFYALVSTLLFGAIGTLVSYDLAELFAFWGLAGATTYLMLAHRWGSDEASRSGRIALALPFVTDLTLLCGIGFVYSHYGLQNLTGLVPILHSTPGVGAKTLTGIAILLFVGVAGRLGLWPLHMWLTRTAPHTPAAASAMVQAVWSIVGIVVLYRLMPIIAAANAQTMRDLVDACAVVAIAAPLLAMFGNEPRRVIVLAGSGVAAVGAGLTLRSYESSTITYAVFGVACVVAAAPARAAAMLAVSSVAAAMRTDDMAEMGDGWRRMRASTMALLLASVVIAMSAAIAVAVPVGTRSRFGLALGEAVLLVSIATIRVAIAVAIGPLRRRRAFEPDRVRDGPSQALAWPYWLVLAGAVLVVGTLFPTWLGYLDGNSHRAPATAAVLIWLAVVAVGLVLTAFGYASNKDGALRASALLGAWLFGWTGRGAAALSRFVWAPIATITVRVNGWIPRGDSELARAAAASGRLALVAARAPAVSLLVIIVAVLAIVVGIASPGLFR
jgi:multicomponent Na+:H+ antiporter subunit D